jgi:2-oxoisovalerate dehydrogenase E1 component
MLTEHCSLPTARLAAEDSFIATGPAYAATMPSVESITNAAIKLWKDT